MDEKFKEYFDQGNQYYENKDFDKALESYNKALEIDNNHAELYKQIGNIYHANEKFGEAIKYYEKAIEIDPKYWAVYNNLGHIYKIYYKDYDKALSYLEKALKYSPNDSGILNNLGNLYYYDLYRSEYYNNTELINEYNQKALDAYNKCILLDKEDQYIINYGNIGNCYYNFENWEKVIFYYSLALKQEIYKTDPFIYQRLAQAYRSLDNLDKAQEYISKALELDPHHEDIIAEQLMIYQELSEYDKMLDFLNSLPLELQNNPRWSVMYYKSYYWLEKHDSAIDFCNKIIKMNPDNPKFYSFRALSYFLTKDYLKAIDDVKIALSFDSTNVADYTGLVKYYFYAKQYDELLDYINNLPIDYLNGEIYYYQGTSFVELELFEKAIESLERAIKFGYEDYDCYTELIWSYRKSNNYQKAIEYAEILLEKNPEDEWLKKTLEEIKKEL